MTAARLSDEVLAMFELSNDLLIGKVKENRYSYYVRESLNLGREAAKRVGETRAEEGEMAGAADIFQLYQEEGIEIIYEEKSGEQYGVSFRAQSEYGKDGSAKVLIYRQSIAELARHSRDVELSEEEALQIHLAHEYFHYLEYHSSELPDEKTMKVYDRGFVSDYLEPVELTRFLGRRRTGGILRCSEIAAHAFARELTGVPVLPNYFDYAYLMAEGKLLKEDFLSRARQFEEYF